MFFRKKEYIPKITNFLSENETQIFYQCSQTLFSNSIQQKLLTKAETAIDQHQESFKGRITKLWLSNTHAERERTDYYPLVNYHPHYRQAYCFGDLLSDKRIHISSRY